MLYHDPLLPRNKWKSPIDFLFPASGGLNNVTPEENPSSSGSAQRLEAFFGLQRRPSSASLRFLPFTDGSNGNGRPRAPSVRFFDIIPRGRLLAGEWKSAVRVVVHYCPPPHPGHDPPAVREEKQPGGPKLKMRAGSLQRRF